jgi:hypothetical protein
MEGKVSPTTMAPAPGTAYFHKSRAFRSPGTTDPRDSLRSGLSRIYYALNTTMVVSRGDPMFLAVRDEV